MAEENTDARINFIRVEKNNIYAGRSFFELGRNAGFFNTDDKLGTSTTAPHEKGHGFGLRHSEPDQRGKGQPDIMSARGTWVDAEYQYDPHASPGAKGGTIDPSKRKVTQKNVSEMLRGVTFDSSGRANLGTVTNTIYKKDGYAK